MSALGKNLLNELEDTPRLKEPAVAVGTIVGSVSGLLSVLLYFFPNIPDGTIKTITVIAAFLLPIVSAYFTRGKVWSPNSVKIVVDEAVAAALEQIGKGGTGRSSLRK